VSFNSRQLVRLLKNMPHKVGAEVGVFRGDTSAGLLGALPDLEQLICVDPWVELEEFKAHCPNKAGAVYNADWALIRARFKERVLEPYRERVLVLNMFSVDAAGLLPNGMLDFAFIDGNHGYEYVREDVIAWWPKVKRGGLMAGDDYQNKPTYGVIKAVNELFNGAHGNRGRIWYVRKDNVTINI
jgi:hypothetical protein